MLNDRRWLHSPGLAKRFALVRIFKSVLLHSWLKEKNSENRDTSQYAPMYLDTWDFIHLLSDIYPLSKVNRSIHLSFSYEASYNLQDMIISQESNIYKYDNERVFWKMYLIVSALVLVSIQYEKLECNRFSIPIFVNRIIYTYYTYI